MCPTYNMYCKECHLTFECHVPIDDRNSQTCCHCNEPVTQVMGCLGFQLKGDGWEKDSYGGIPPKEVDLND